MTKFSKDFMMSLRQDGYELGWSDAITIASGELYALAGGDMGERGAGIRESADFICGLLKDKENIIGSTKQ